MLTDIIVYLTDRPNVMCVCAFVRVASHSGPFGTSRRGNRYWELAPDAPDTALMEPPVQTIIAGSVPRLAASVSTVDSETHMALCGYRRGYRRLTRAGQPAGITTGGPFPGLVSAGGAGAGGQLVGSVGPTPHRTLADLSADTYTPALFGSAETFISPINRPMCRPLIWVSPL